MTEWRIPLSRPDIDDDDRQAVLRVLETSCLSLGPEAARLEAEFSERLHDRPTALVSSGTAGLFLALRALGFDQGEVLTPSFGFAGTVHAIRLAGGQPRFADISPDTLCVTVETLEAAYTPDCRAVMPADIFGTPIDAPVIREWARERDLVLVQDACEALGGTCAGDPVGVHAPASVFAFYPNKQMTTGEGGLVVCSDEDVAARIRSRRNQGRGAREFEFVDEGFNFRITELQAALGRSQLRRLDDFLDRREAIATRYLDALSNVDGVACLPPVRAGDRRSWFVFPVFVEDPAWRDPARQALADRGIQTAPYFPALHGFPPFRRAERRGRLPVTEAVSCRSFALPFHNRLSPEQLSEVVDTLAGALPQGAGSPDFSLQTLLTPSP